MTAVSDAYDGLRAGGFTYRQAVRFLAREVGVDEGTIVRTLTRADRPAHRERERPVSVVAGSAPTQPSRRRRPAAAGRHPQQKETMK